MEKEFVKKAVALEYDSDIHNAPKVTASGSRENAKNIIKVAMQNDIPIKKDQDLVEMLSQIETNQEIPIELYQAVSEVFSFIYGITNNKNKEKENI